RFSRDWSSDVCSSDLAGQLHRALERLDADRHRAHGRVLGELGLHAGGDGGVVDVLADGGLVAGDGAADGGEGEQAGQGEGGGGEIGRASWRERGEGPG